MSNSGSDTIWYTLDGSDPRLPGGAVNTASAATYSSAITLTKTTPVKARARSGGDEWSALAEAVYVDEEIAGSVRVTEMMYHPAVADANTEFIELQNVGTQTINLNLVKFTNGVDFTFGDTSLNVGQYVLIVQNQTAFEAKYGGSLNVAGQYTGQLDNNGEKIEIEDGLGNIIQSFKYEDNWYELTDGMGFSLTIVDANSTDPNSWSYKYGWRSSLGEGGTPGSSDTVLAADSIVFNELLSHSHAASPDWIELYNKTGQNINIGGWFLSDDDSDANTIRKYEIPSGTIIYANDYMVFVEDTSFGDPCATGCNTPFGLSEGGETVYLYSGQSGEVTGYYQTQQKFDASETDVSFGRYEKAELSGGYDFTRMISKTQGYANSGPLIPDIVITEIYYNPPSGTDYEYVELYNRSGSAVTLMTSVTTEYTPGVFTPEDISWRLEGTGYEFPNDVTIGAGDYIIVAKDPTKYISATCDVYGPYDGKLDNGGEELEIQIPGDKEYGRDRYWIPIEKIDYDDEFPWPTSPDGGGDSLDRINVTTYGRDYSNWQADTPNPCQ
jgi:hypothetical protein